MKVKVTITKIIDMDDENTLGYPLRDYINEHPSNLAEAARQWLTEHHGGLGKDAMFHAEVADSSLE